MLWCFVSLGQVVLTCNLVVPLLTKENKADSESDSRCRSDAAVALFYHQKFQPPCSGPLGVQHFIPRRTDYLHIGIYIL